MQKKLFTYVSACVASGHCTVSSMHGPLKKTQNLLACGVINPCSNLSLAVLTTIKNPPCLTMLKSHLEHASLSLENCADMASLIEGCGVGSDESV